MTTERELEIESRLTALETMVAEIKQKLESKTAAVMNFVGSTAGGVVVGVVLWWVTKGK